MDLHSKVSYSSNILTSDIDDEVVMLNIESSHYYGAESVGKFIFHQIEKPITITHLIDKLLTEFDVDRETCIKEVCAFLENLHQQDLIHIDT
jgi:hypothetical protein